MTTNVLDPKEFPEILKMVRTTGGKYIIIEEGKPAFVVLSVDEYKKLISGKEKNAKSDGKELVEKINQDIADWKMKQDEEKDDYLKYIPERFRPGRDNNEDSDADEIIEEDLAYHYDVDDEDENERYNENIPF